MVQYSGLPEAIDLDALSRAARKLPGGAELAEAVIATHDAAVVVRSLNQAKALLEELARLAARLRSLEADQEDEVLTCHLLGRAALSQAVFHYTQVAHGKTSLQKLNIKKFNDIQTETHSEILTLRNEAMAHYVHRKHQELGPWDRQFVIWMPNQQRLRTPNLFVNWRAGLSERFYEHLQSVAPIAHDHLQVCYGKLNTALEAFSWKCPEFDDRLPEFSLDLSIFTDPVRQALLEDRIVLTQTYTTEGRAIPTRGPPDKGAPRRTTDP